MSDDPATKDATDNDDASDPDAPPPQKRKTAKVDDSIYEAAWRIYRAGHTKMEVARRVGVTWETVDRMVEKGYPKRHLPPLKDRLAQYQRERIAKMSGAAARLEKDEWEKARRENMGMAAAAKAALVPLLRSAVQAASQATFMKTRRVRNEEGQWTTVQMPATLMEVAEAVRTIVAAIAQVGQHESFWLGGPTERKEVVPGQLPAGWFSLSEEQLAFIAEKGQLPPGVDEATLWGTDVPAEQKPS